MDIVSVSELDSLFSESSEKGESETASSAHVGKVVVKEDVAFVTYASLPISLIHTLRLYAKDSKHCSGTYTRTRSNSLRGGPRRDAKPGPLRGYQSRTEFPNRHPSMSTGSPTRSQSAVLSIQQGLTSSLVRHPRAEGARVATNSTRPEQV